MKVFGVGVIGCGLIGQKRAKALGSGGKLVACADLDADRAQNLAKTSGAQVSRDWRELIFSPHLPSIGRGLRLVVTPRLARYAFLRIHPYSHTVSRSLLWTGRLAMG